MRLHLLSAAVIVALSSYASAADSLTIDRSLKREPAYGAKPQYCLLVFGPEAKTRVWVVAAGEAFYADRNGDGNLTEPGKRVYAVGNYRSLFFLDPNTTTMWLPVPENERIYQLGDIFDAASRTWYNVTVRRSGNLKTAVFEVLVDIKGKFRQLGRLPRFGDKPQDAPVLHFNGPLTLGLFTLQLVRGRAGTQIESWIGTNVPAGANGQPTYLVHDDGVPSYVFPMARIEFGNEFVKGKSIQTTVRLEHRDRWIRFSGWMRVPDEAAIGKAKVTLSARGWKWGSVHPLTAEIPVVEPGKRSKELDRK
jgi:hypothetical protein